MRRKHRNWLTVAVLRIIIALGLLLPYKLRMRFGGRLIATISAIPPHARIPIEKHTSIIFPDWGKDDRKRFIKANLQHFGQNMMEMYNIANFAKRQDRFHVSGPGLGVLISQKDQGKGAVCVSGHFGQWEAIRAYMNANDMQMAGLYKKHSNKYYEAMFGKALNFSGPMFHTGVRGMAGLVRILKSGRFISLLHDQKVEGAPLLDFLGKPAHTSTAAAELALKYDVPLIPIYGIRRENGYDYDIIVEAPVTQSDPETMAKNMNQSLAEMIVRHPEQWLWIYDRWHQFTE